MSEKRLESRSNPRIRFFRGLERREAREESGCFPAEGVRLVLEALRSTLPVKELFLADDLDPALEVDLRRALSRRAGEQISVYRLAPDLFHALAHTRQPQGAAAVVSRGPRPTLEALARWSRVVVLHRPADPGNVGAIMRSAEAAGFAGMVVVEPACDPWNPKAVRASMGSVFRLPVVRATSLDQVLESLAGFGFQVLAALPRGGRSLYEVEIRSPLAVLFGGETEGLPPLAAWEKRKAQTSFLDNWDLALFSLPMRGEVESLNLAQAVTAVLYEVLRRDHSPSRKETTR